jgi:hypothetical protein
LDWFTTGKTRFQLNVDLIESGEANMFNKELIKNCIFDWRDLHGKVLGIRVVESEGVLHVYGIESDHEGSKLYLLHE